jgi:hypothetical protein
LDFGADAGFGAGVSADIDMNFKEIGMDVGFGAMQFGADAHVGVSIQLTGTGVENGAFGQSQICAGLGIGACFNIQSQGGQVSTSLTLGAVEGVSFSNSLMRHQALLGPAPLPAPAGCQRAH